MGNDTRVVGFPEAGDEVVLVFRNKDIRDLQAKIGDDFMTKISQKFEMLDLECIYTVLQVGLKKNGKRYEQKDFDALEESVFDKMKIHDLRERALDGLQLSISGEKWSEYIKRIFEDMKKAQEAGAAPGSGEGGDGPLSNPETSSSVSETKPLESESVL